MQHDTIEASEISPADRLRLCGGRMHHFLLKLSNAGISESHDLVEEPGALFGSVDPVLDQAGGGDVIVAVADLVRRTQILCEFPVIDEELPEHRLGAKTVRVVVLKPLMAGDVSDRTKRRAAELAGAFRHRIDHREELLRLIVEHEVEVPKMLAGHVPVEALRFHVEREDIGQQLAQRARDLLGTRGSEIRDAEGGYIVGRGIGRFHGSGGWLFEMLLESSASTADAKTRVEAAGGIQHPHQVSIKAPAWGARAVIFEPVGIQDLDHGEGRLADRFVFTVQVRR